MGTILLMDKSKRTGAVTGTGGQKGCVGTDVQQELLFLGERNTQMWHSQEEKAGVNMLMQLYSILTTSWHGPPLSECNHKLKAKVPLVLSLQVEHRAS